ncbi:transposon Ty3-I Gag-Pol polyprotein [Elysia marginata]|uniref:Transposon Ty3-I Gag-Pol polyprotein n=1 Tax=Elysia marginata TaxID=1093978 RepID=A0AAV4F9R3_9GAST|nr:transposon Ty3-I Gag-Pol polyprotein [Elysia marginata]
MTVSLGTDKRRHVDEMIKRVCTSAITVRDLAQIIGVLVACFPAVEYGCLFYRDMELLKIETLGEAHNYDRHVSLTASALAELHWWSKEGIYSSKPLMRGRPVAIIRTDSSSFAWGAVMGDASTHGMWSCEEKQKHIDVLELKAALLGIQSLCQTMRNCHLRIEIDNTTAVAYIKNMGGTHSTVCNDITKELLTWCKARGIWLSAYHNYPRQRQC